MKSPEQGGPVPLRIKTPQQEQEKRLKDAERKIARGQEAIQSVEEKILRYRNNIAKSKEFIDEMYGKLAQAPTEAEQNSIKEAIRVEEKNIQNFTDGVEAAYTQLAGFYDNKKVHEGHAFDERIDLRKKLH